MSDPRRRLPLRPRPIVAVLLTLGLVAGGCTAGDPKPIRGVVLIVVDTLRADHLGSYGYHRETSPRMDRLAREGVLFRDAQSPAPWTLPSLATIMTSLYPSVHGAHSPSNLGDSDWLFRPDRYRPFSALHDSRVTLAEVLRDAGFATFGAVQGSYPTTVFGIGQGFDVYHQNETPGIRFDVEDALAWLDAENPERFLIYLHVGEVHAPYTPVALPPRGRARLPKERMPYFRKAIAEEALRFRGIDFDPDYAGSVDGSLANLRKLSRRGARIRGRDLDHLVALYDRGVAYADHWIGELVERLDARGIGDETLLIVTADHGEEFLEHGRLEHSFSYYQEMLGVPLLIRVPDEGRGVTVTQPVGLVDIMPTVLDVLGVEHAAEMQGRSLRPLWLAGSGTSNEERPAPYLGEASFRRGDTALRTGTWKYIQSRPPRTRGAAAPSREELYDLAADPGERQNLCASAPARCAQYREELRARTAEHAAVKKRLALPEPEPAAIDAETLEDLRALGYLE